MRHHLVQRLSSPVRRLGLTASLVTILWGCGQTPAPQTDQAAPSSSQPQVVATTSLLCDLTRQVAVDTIHLTCLISPGQDPHTYQPKPSDRQAIDGADLILYGGYNFAPTIFNLIQASPNPAVRVAVFEAAVPHPLMVSDQDHDHHQGATEPQFTSSDGNNSLTPDPHIWHNAANVAAIVKVIATDLETLNPSQADLYAANASILANQFADINRWIITQVATVPPGHRKLVTTHDSFNYFAAAYGFTVQGALGGLSTDRKPAAGELTALVDQVKAAQVPAIFAETTTNPELIATVARDAGVIVATPPLFVEGPGGPGSQAETTQAMLVANTCTIVRALGGTCDTAQAPI